MKKPALALFLFGLALAALAADPASLSWRADLSTTEVRNLYLRHGDSATLSARLFLRGAPYTPTNAVVYYQTNGMGRAWWTLPAAVSSNTVSLAWTPLYEKTGVSIYPLLFRIDDQAYRAAAMLYLRRAPGAEPDATPGVVLDFATLAYTNAPWATSAEAASAALSALSEAVSALDSGHADTVDEVGDLLLDLIEKLKNTNPNPQNP